MNKKWLLGGGLVGMALVLFGVWFVFLRDDAPDVVTNAAANADLDEVLASDVTPDDDTDDAPASVDVPTTEGDPTEAVGFDGTINGIWVVDDEIGEFDFDTASGSFAGFRVAEELAAVGDVTAVGRSGGVAGALTIADGILTGAEIVVDMTTIVSNESRREGAIRRTVGSDDFPTAMFVFAEAVDVSALEVGGAPITFAVGGELTVKGVTQPTTFEIEANVRADGFAIITGSAELIWEDFGVTPPSAPVVVSIADEGIVEFQLVVAQA